MFLIVYLSIDAYIIFFCLMQEFLSVFVLSLRKYILMQDFGISQADNQAEKHQQKNGGSG